MSQPSRTALFPAQVRVVRGQYNGYRGRVKNQTATHVQLELDAITRVVTIKISDIQPESGGSTGGPPRAALNSARQGYGANEYRCVYHLHY